MGSKHDHLCFSAPRLFCCSPRLAICFWSLMRGLPAVLPSHSADACLCRCSPAPRLLPLPPSFLISSLPCQCISEALCVLPLLVILPSSNLNLRLLLSPPPPHPRPHFIFFSFSLLEPQNMSLFPSFLLFPFLSAQYPVSVWPHLWTFLLFLPFPARCHHLIISGLFDYILCPWLWRGCHEGAFGLMLNLLLSLSHTHTRANTHK